jgi:putative SOS response-associated peptidase YedK
MCNLYTVRKSADEVASHFGVRTPCVSNASEEIYPGTPGVVVREQDGERVMQSMTWGFPLRLKTMSPKPVNNIADLQKPMWKGLAAKPQWRCLIPLTGFAEAEGAKGSMTRTWFNVKDKPIFAWAGLWRVSDEWGQAGVVHELPAQHLDDQGTVMEQYAPDGARVRGGGSRLIIHALEAIVPDEREQ